MQVRNSDRVGWSRVWQNKWQHHNTTASETRTGIVNKDAAQLTGYGDAAQPPYLHPSAPHSLNQQQAELESAGGADALITAFQGLGDPLPLEDGSDCFAAQLPRVLVRILRALLPLVTAHPPPQRPNQSPLAPHGNGSGGAGDATALAAATAAMAAAAAAEAESALGESFYGLAAAVVELLATLAAHGAAAELNAVGLDGLGGGNTGDGRVNTGGGRGGGNSESGGRGGEGGAGGSRWVKEIAVGVGGSDLGGSGGGGGGGWGSGGGGSGVAVLEACWTVSRDIDGVQGE